MRSGCGILATLLAGAVCLPAWAVACGLPGGGLGLDGQGQAFAGPGATAGMEGIAPTGAGTAVPSDTAETSRFAEGTKAIDANHWADAVKIFTEVANQHGDHADGALYWKAYAENKLGEAKPAQAACAELRKDYPKSRWIEDCGALEVEVRARTGKPVEIDPGASDDVKLLALNAMLKQDEPRALAEIQAILNGDGSEKLKKEAQFILGKHYSNVTYAQIVRIRFVEGDVRIQRGEPAGKTNGAIWEKAEADLPLETGFSLATGAGRAEIELEDASTLYLGENSVLTFNDLHETAGIPYSDLGLLAGTVSLHVHPYVGGEKFILRTPSADLVAHYPDKTYARVESFADAMTVTPLKDGDLRLTGVPRDAAVPGRTWTWTQGQLVDRAGAADAGTLSSWDAWVDERITQRDAAMAAMMEKAGLTEPIPGLADMQGRGKFFDCAPYGTCWEPADAAQQDEEAAMRPRNQRGGFQLAAYQPGIQESPATGTGQRATSAFDETFPCTPLALRYRMVKDPGTGRQTVMAEADVQSEPYDWAVCHAGSWIRHRRHYVWVAGTKRRHVDPVRWVRSGRQIAFTPLHPFDVKGQPAINARHEVFAVSGKGPFEVRPVKLEPNSPIEYLKEAPREYRTAALRPLARAEAPHMEARMLHSAPGSKDTTVGKATIPIHFDAKTQTFQVPKEEMHGGKSTTVFAPMSNRNGSLQARAPSFSGGSGAHGSSGSVGGTHAGGSGSSGGGSHGGGSRSSASSSSSGAAASSGGSHH